MSSPATAEIIPFPVRRPEAADAPAIELTGVDEARVDVDVTRLEGTADSEAQEAQARLVRALQSLDAALTEQRTAIAAWRGALSDLRATMQGLSNSVQTYRGSLATLDTKVTNLRGEAGRLERWADNALTIAGESGPATAL
ncbi:MAG: hypothetical protein P4L71_18775 [Acetobacteraceae bacterium]|nr:hypothetical protein [Acetobacteraceae bacterium]